MHCNVDQEISNHHCVYCVHRTNIEAKTLKIYAPNTVTKFCPLVDLVAPKETAVMMSG